MILARVCLLAIMMPAIKRQASDSFNSSNQVVLKKQKSNSNIQDGAALTVAGRGAAKDGALVAAVSEIELPDGVSGTQRYRMSWLTRVVVVPANECPPRPDHGVHWPLR